ncbi:MAG TPA: hypothetical protein VHF89_07300, partial [Solirubrobacteraceae bacterium]|nr:hypothetical protein [Solirubrobacteraceae bacterium]
ARQPWIDVSEAEPLEGPPGAVLSRAVQVRNRGTGTLRIGDPVGLALGGGFELAAVPGPLAPNRCGELVVGFRAPAAAGTASGVYVASSNDTTAREVAGHNRRVALSAVVRKLAPRTIVAIGRTGEAEELLAIDPRTGTRLRLAPPPPSIRPSALAIDADLDHLLVAGTAPGGGAGRVVRVDPTTGQQTDAAGGQPLSDPRAIAVEQDGRILVADAGAFEGEGAVIRVDLATGAQTVLALGADVFRRPVGLAVDRDGRILLLAEELFAGMAVLRIHPQSGGVAKVADVPSNLVQASALAIEPAGTVLVAYTSGIAGGGFTGTVGQVDRFDLATGQRNRVTGGNSLRAFALAVEADGSVLIAGEDEVGGVLRVDPATGARTPLSTAAGGAIPHAIAVVPAGG